MCAYRNMVPKEINYHNQSKCKNNRVWLPNDKFYIIQNPVAS